MIKTAKKNNVVQFGGGTDWKAWAGRINEAWQKSVEGVLEAGRLLLEAKEELQHGTFENMIRLELNFGLRTAQMLMGIAANPTLSNPKHVSLLPPSWGTLAQLDKAERKLGEGTIARWLADGTVTPKTERKEIAALIAPDEDEEPEAKPEKRKRHPKPEYNASEDSQHDRDLRALLGLWESACESARLAFLEQVTS
jgi:hypothetical protein